MADTILVLLVPLLVVPFLLTVLDWHPGPWLLPVIWVVLLAWVWRPHRRPTTTR